MNRLSKDVIISITLFYFIVIFDLIHKIYEKQLLHIYFIGISFLYFHLFLLEFESFIDFQSADVVHTHSGSTLDFCIIFVNGD